MTNCSNDAICVLSWNISFTFTNGKYLVKSLCSRFSNSDGEKLIEDKKLYIRENKYKMVK